MTNFPKKSYIFLPFVTKVTKNVDSLITFWRGGAPYFFNSQNFKKYFFCFSFLETQIFFINSQHFSDILWMSLTI